MTTYYTVSAVPAAHSFGSSAYIRTEYTLIQTAFATVNTEMASKAPLESPTFTGTAVLPGTTSIGNVSDTEIAYLDGVTSSIQTQLNSLNTSKGLIAGQAWTGSHDFTGATTTVATQAASDATDKAASTAMVQAALTAYAGTNLGLPTYTIADALSVVRLNSLATDYEWTGLKTVNGESIMGSGDVAIPAPTGSIIYLASIAGAL